MKKLSVGVIGATGEVGRSFAESLSHHPFFELNTLYASERSAGKKYGDLVTGRAINTTILEKRVTDISDIIVEDNDVYFSALPGSTAYDIEEKVAQLKPVFSTTSSHRYDPDVPIYVLGANDDHYKLLDVQRRKRKHKGFVCPQSNCTTVGLVISLKPLFDTYGIQNVLVTSHQAVSGAGHALELKWLEQRQRQGTAIPTALPYDKRQSDPLIEGNVIPYIKDEEEKVVKETKKILGTFTSDHIEEAKIKIAASCNRVPVKDGHLEDIFVFLKKTFTVEDVIATWNTYQPHYKTHQLPSAPSKTIIYLHDSFSPQPRFDITREDGMTITIGRAQRNELDGLQYKVLSHNTKLGAAKGCVLAAEYLHAINFI